MLCLLVCEARPLLLFASDSCAGGDNDVLHPSLRAPHPRQPGGLLLPVLSPAVLAAHLVWALGLWPGLAPI